MWNLFFQAKCEGLFLDPVTREISGDPNVFVITSHTRRGIRDGRAHNGCTPIICLTDEDAEGQGSHVVQMLTCRSAISQDFAS